MLNVITLSVVMLDVNMLNVVRQLVIIPLRAFKIRMMFVIFLADVQ